MHPSRRVASVNAITVETTPRPSHRVMAVQWEEHDPLTCDGQDLQIDTTGFLDCPVSQCRWSYDPEAKCPDHVDA